MTARRSATRAVIVAVALAAASCGAPERSVGFVPYLGQSPPGSTPERFAPGIVNTDAIEINGVFSPDGRSFFFSRQVDGDFTIFRSDFGEAGWGTPMPMSVYRDGAHDLAVDMSVTTDGGLYFSSERPGGFGRNDLYVSFREEGGGWSTPKNLGPSIFSSRAATAPRGRKPRRERSSGWTPA